ncbi:hypothetical protein [Bacillus sp. FJAT-45350]|uniref:LexA family protein n=1 Tax=Bacillus sp. FJAT-45350 TaxID=2011014 RepID=UPI000BB8FF5E|nr:hypothetical protein [Bacillus sp. FJAT-45350]
MKKLTKRQTDILLVITEFIREHNYAPSTREVGELAGLRSSSTVHGHMEQLRRKGYLDWVESKPRTMRVLKSNSPSS